MLNASIMAKSKRKQRKKQKDGGGGTPFWAHLLSETLGNFAGQLMADGTEQMAKGTPGGVDADGATEAQDVAADVLRVVAESGPKSIADLIAETGTGLTPMLQALQTTREFRLIEIVGDDDLVQLTPAGSRTASVLRRAEIEADGMKQLTS